MGKDKHEKLNHRLPPFVPLLIETMDSQAWRAMSHGARSLYVALKRRYSPNNHNNGRMFISQRTAAQELGSHHNEIARWFRELQHFGFIVLASPGCLGLDGRGKAPHWRLTELGCMKDAPTRNFLCWDETKFKDRKTESRAGKGARGVREKAHTTVREKAHTQTRKRAGNGAHTARQGVREKAHITSIPLGTPSNSSKTAPDPLCVIASPELAATIKRWAQ